MAETNAERLKRIRGFMDWAVSKSTRINKYIDNMIIDDTKWIIEQAEHAEELEKQLDKLDDEYQKDIANAEGAKRSYKKQRDSLKEENAKLREALKFYADEETYNDHSIADGYVYTNMKIYDDQGEKARTSLERESK